MPRRSDPVEVELDSRLGCVDHDAREIGRWFSARCVVAEGKRCLEPFEDVRLAAVIPSEKDNRGPYWQLYVDALEAAERDPLQSHVGRVTVTEQHRAWSKLPIVMSSVPRWSSP